MGRVTLYPHQLSFKALGGTLSIPKDEVYGPLPQDGAAILLISFVFSFILAVAPVGLSVFAILDVRKQVKDLILLEAQTNIHEKRSLRNHCLFWQYPARTKWC